MGYQDEKLIAGATLCPAAGKFLKGGSLVKRKLIACVALGCLAALTAVAAEMMNVQVREGQVRSAPSFLGKIVGTVSYGQSVTVTGANGDWSQVAHAGGQGWIHSSALTTEVLGLRSGSGQAPTSVSGQEMALAGKGFTAQVEQKYRQTHGGDFASVDRMEKGTLQTGQLMSFLQEGGVKPQGGVQ